MKVIEGNDYLEYIPNSLIRLPCKYISFLVMFVCMCVDEGWYADDYLLSQPNRDRNLEENDY